MSSCFHLNALKYILRSLLNMLLFIEYVVNLQVLNQVLKNLCLNKTIFHVIGIRNTDRFEFQTQVLKRIPPCSKRNAHFLGRHTSPQTSSIHMRPFFCLQAE